MIIYNVYLHRSCYVNHDLISIGDDVIVETEDEREAVGRIQSLYRDSTSLGKGPCRAVLHWYFKKHELPKNVKDKIGTFLSEENELFWPAEDVKNLRRCVDDIDAETVREKCRVAVLPSSFSNRRATGKYCIRYGFTFDNKLVSDRELSVLLARIENPTKEPDTPVSSRTRPKESRRASQGIYIFKVSPVKILGY